MSARLTLVRMAVILWTGNPLDTPTDIYRVLADGTTVRTATVGGQAEKQMLP